MFGFEKKLWKNFDIILFLDVLLLNACGFVVIYLATLESSAGYMRYLKPQGIAFILGIVAILVLCTINYDLLRKLYLPIYIFCNLLLLAVLIIGKGDTTWGARSWLIIGPIRFQPSEIAKIGIIISLAQYIDKNSEHINELRVLLKVLIFAFVPVALVLKQPDLGTATVFIFYTVIMLFIAGVKIKYYLYSIGLGLISIPFVWMNLGKYQKNRILVFLNPAIDTSGAGYQVYHSKIAIGSGELFGRLISNEARFIKSGYLPEKHTDFIFSVIGESFGFIGGCIILLLFFILIYRLIKNAREAKDLFASLTIIGITSLITFHILENIGMTMGLTPVTGIPLPFISYGGTFLLSNMISIGIVLSISMRKNKINF
ncbi:rod shape-determining protein RodA [Abyssisolibacter fermentans]|uniref:rod shape-determining protein RodA n=1 Tax=Abyssisolibacter fermentans TaxID=1766203 RepID=UPI00082DAAA9|nr:rod shape-determining protein RodA [Abyssisolibacter fermentans]